MGYFSNLVIEDSPFCYDVSWTSHEQQLLWRWEELHNRLEELQARGAAYSGSAVCTQEDLRYALPDCFHTIYDVGKAIELAARDLKEKYGIDMQPEIYEEPGIDEITGNQLSLFVVLPPVATAA